MKFLTTIVVFAFFLVTAFSEPVMFWHVETDLCVTDFGAKGDGTTDDTEALQRAADALADKNGDGVEPRYYKAWWTKSDREQVRLVFPRGKYRITAPVFFRCKAHVVGDEAEIVQENPSADAFYLCRGFIARFSGFRFRGGKSQIRICTHNNEGSHLYVGDCSFYGSSASAIECLTYRSTVGGGNGYDRSKEVGEWDWNARTRKYERDRRWDASRVPSNNSTLFLVERCFFDDCAHAIEASCDGSVYRQCKVFSKRSSPGGAILGRNLIHAYDMDIVIRRDRKLKQAAFESVGKFLWLEDSKMRTDDGSGAPLVICSRREGGASYLASSVTIKNVETETGDAPGVIEIAHGRPVNLVSLLRVKETGRRKNVPMLVMKDDATDEILSKISPSAAYPVDLSYSFCLRDCTGIVQPTGRLARFMRPEPDVRSGTDILRRRSATRRKGPVLFASADGVDADSSTDDTAAFRRFLSRLAKTPGAIGVLPGARLAVKGPFDIRGDFELVGAGLTLLDTDPTCDLFRVAADSGVSFKNLMTCGGRTLFDVGVGADVRVEGCIIYNPQATAFQIAEKARFLMDDGMVYAAKFYEGMGDAFISSVWFRFLRSCDANSRPGAAIVNRGRLQMWDMLGVPVLFSKYAMNDVFHPELPPTEYRWVDNSGIFFSRMCRYGGEWGGVTPVFHHGEAVTAIEGSYAWFTTTFTYPTPILCDTPSPNVRCFSVTFSPLFEYLPDIGFKWRKREGEKLLPVNDGRFDVCYPMMRDQTASIVPMGNVRASASSLVTVDVVANRENAVYPCGEQARMAVTVFDKASGKKLSSGRLSFRLDDFGKTIVNEGEIDLADGNPFEISGTLKRPGVLRLKILPKDGTLEVESRAGQHGWGWGAAFGVPDIRPTLPCPGDFASFWKEARTKLDRTIPVDPQMTEVPSMETRAARYYRISVASFGRRVYGMMSIPKEVTEKLPVWVYVPGAGCEAWSNYLAEFDAKAINVVLTVFPWEVDWSDGGKDTKAKYQAMLADMKSMYGINNYGPAGLDAAMREECFFYPVILGCVRALECIAAMPRADPRRMYYYGSSQGGGLGIALTALFGRFAASACLVPAFCDLDVESTGRLGAWPVSGLGEEFRKRARTNARYFDACNFSKLIKTPIVYEVGGGDLVNPPHCGLAAHAMCPSSSKLLVFNPAQGHDAGVKMKERLVAWIRGHRFSGPIAKRNEAFFDEHR